MTDIPTRNKDDSLDCPRCGTPLVHKKAPFFLHREFIGNFEALVCEICGYSLLTSAGYDAAIREARNYGLVGPQEEIINERLESALQQFVLQDINVSSNVGNKIDTEEDISVLTIVGKITEDRRLNTHYPSKLTQALIR